MKNAFANLISSAKDSPESEVFFTRILVVNPGSDREFYIDQRTKDLPDGKKAVWPVCWHNGYYWYVCPDCQQLHMTEETGEQQTGCCSGDDYRIQHFKGEWFPIDRSPINLMEPNGGDS